MNTLVVNNVTLKFGGIIALNYVNFEVREKELLSLIGPNGAGKTSVINCICSYYKPQSGGDILFGGHNLTRLPPHVLPALGITRTFQNVELFYGMTVMDNLKLGLHHDMQGSLVEEMLSFGRVRKAEKKVVEFLEDEIITRLGLKNVVNELVGTLPYGLQKRVDLGRALAAKPKLLILDEPVAGMNSEESMAIVQVLKEYHQMWGFSVLLVEHDMEVVMNMSDRVVVFNFGQKIAEGKPWEVQKNEQVIEIYLGKHN